MNKSDIESKVLDTIERVDHIDMCDPQTLYAIQGLTELVAEMWNVLKKQDS